MSINDLNKAVEKFSDLIDEFEGITSNESLHNTRDEFNRLIKLSQKVDKKDLTKSFKKMPNDIKRFQDDFEKAMHSLNIVYVDMQDYMNELQVEN